MSTIASLSPYEVLARYERRSLAHASDMRERQDAPGLWRGIGYRVGSRLFVSSIDEINELLAPPVLARVPGAQPWLLGIANVRGNLMPVVDLGRFLFGERTQPGERTRLLVVRQGSGSVALMVDEVFGQRTVDACNDNRCAPKTIRACCASSITRSKWATSRLALFDMSRLVRAPDFRQAAA